MSSPHPSLIEEKTALYTIRKVDREFQIDCDWTKPEWKNTKPLHIARDNGWLMDFRPATMAKLCYSDKSIYVIFNVADNYVRCLTAQTNGEVWKDACVEFFFAPSPKDPARYFNLEINCGGTIRWGHRDGTDLGVASIPEEDVGKIKICHSLPSIIKKEIDSPLTWFIEIAVPFELIMKYTGIRAPGQGDRWRVNFFKCAENNSRPHWLSWAAIASPAPNFHLPEFFGELEFG